MSALTQGYDVAPYSRAASLAGAAWEYLAALPVIDPERNRLREVIRQQGDRLASAAAKYLSLNAEYIARRSFAKARYAPIVQTHPWRGLLTTQRAEDLKYPYSRDQLDADYLREFDHLNNLRACPMDLPQPEREAA